jgi:poly(hydroxyalkanoate) granule associated protein phasin
MAKKSTLEKTQDQVWLAGLGALAIAEQEGSDLFQRLVQRGWELKQVGRVKGREAFSDKEKPELAALRRRLVLAALDPQRKQSAPVDPQDVRARQARRLESARRTVLKEFGTPQEAVRDYERLKQERRIFTVSHRDATYVPSFQFDEKGRPRPAVARVIQILGDDTSDWGLALWFTAANGWLDGKRPVDLLKDEPEEVVQAAEQEAAELVF